MPMAKNLVELRDVYKIYGEGRESEVRDVYKRQMLYSSDPLPVTYMFQS